MSTQTESHPTRAVLTVLTGRLLTKRRDADDNGIGDLYKLLRWMTGEMPYTHQLARFISECEPCLTQCFPELAAEAEPLNERHISPDVDVEDKSLIPILAELEKRFGETLPVPRLPDGIHLEVDTIAELREMMRKGDR